MNKQEKELFNNMINEIIREIEKQEEIRKKQFDRRAQTEVSNENGKTYKKQLDPK